jgi:hypothetical protein
MIPMAAQGQYRAAMGANIERPIHRQLLRLIEHRARPDQ